MERKVMKIEEIEFNVGDDIFFKKQDGSTERAKIVMVDKTVDYACIMYDNTEIDEGPLTSLLNYVVMGKYNRISQNN